MSEKIQKILARAGVASRRACEDLIKQKRVALNGKIVTIGDRANPDDVLQVDGKPINTDAIERMVLLYHKPEGVICSRSDDQGRDLIFDQLPACPAGRWLYVGRLDINSSGLLLLTNDGDYANQLIHPSKHLERTYLVRVIGYLSNQQLDQLRAGIKLEDGMAKFSRIKKLKSSGGRNNWYEVGVLQGRNRIVRRLFAALDISVNRLIRIKLGNLQLPKDLAPGQYMILKKEALQAAGLL